MNWLRTRLYQMSLFQRLLILGAILFIGVLGLVVYVTQEATRSLERHIMQERLVGSQVVAHSLDEVLRHAILEFQVTAGVIEAELADLEAVQHRLSLRGVATEGANVFIKALTLFDALACRVFVQSSGPAICI